MSFSTSYSRDGGLEQYFNEQIWSNSNDQSKGISGFYDDQIFVSSGLNHPTTRNGHKYQNFSEYTFMLKTCKTHMPNLGDVHPADNYGKGTSVNGMKEDASLNAFIATETMNEHKPTANIAAAALAVNAGAAKPAANIAEKSTANAAPLQKGSQAYDSAMLSLLHGQMKATVVAKNK